MATLVEIDKLDVKFLNNLDSERFDRRYACNDSGQVYLIKQDGGKTWVAQPMSPFVTRDGYVEYVLTSITKRKIHIQAQRIVAGLYCKKKPGCNYVNHKNSTPNNDM